jgi:hypothetical protein
MLSDMCGLAYIAMPVRGVAKFWATVFQIPLCLHTGLLRHFHGSGLFSLPHCVWEVGGRHIDVYVQEREKEVGSVLMFEIVKA